MLRGEPFLAPVDHADEIYTAVDGAVVLEVVRSRERLATPIYLAVIRALARVRAGVLLEIALGRELLLARVILAVKGFARVKAHVCRQSIAGVERLVTPIFVTQERLLARVDAPVHLQAVRGYEGLVTAFELAAEIVLSLVGLQVRSQVTHRGVGPVTAVVDALEALRPRFAFPGRCVRFHGQSTAYAAIKQTFTLVPNNKPHPYHAYLWPITLFVNVGTKRSLKTNSK